ncbi:hypothetical protein GCM10010350_81760 [Streptomyces galilaeus]|nr:hypothetical protein GCM10010350_81760 [Streptomyces galilaeus]
MRVRTSHLRSVMGPGRDVEAVFARVALPCGNDLTEGVSTPSAPHPPRLAARSVTIGRDRALIGQSLTEGAVAEAAKLWPMKYV